MRPRVAVVICLVGLTLAGCVEFERLIAPEEEAETPYDRGRQFLADGNYGVAVEEFRAAVLAEPSSVAALNGLAAAYDRVGRFDLAARYYERALRLAPDSAQTLNNYGVSFLMQGRPDLAFVYLGEARQFASEDASIAANYAAAAAAALVQPVAEETVEERRASAEDKPIRRMTAAVQRLFTRVADDAVVPTPRPRPVPENAAGSEGGLGIELSMLEPDPAALYPSVKGGVKQEESPKPYSYLTIEIGESVGSS